MNDNKSLDSTFFKFTFEKGKRSANIALFSYGGNLFILVI